MERKYFHENQPLNRAALTNPGEIVRDKSGNVIGYNEYNIGLSFTPAGDDNDFKQWMKSFNPSSAYDGLLIPTGADEITWGYGMNMKRVPTYGGEVVQILSTFADKMTIKGTCRNYHEMMSIANYFRGYIQYTTGWVNKERHQKFLKFVYPARSWSFIIMVTDVQDIRFSRDIVAPQWSITAEIVSENDRYALGEQRTDQWASVLNQPINSKTYIKVKKAVRGPRNFSKSSNPFGNLTEFADGRRGKIAENFDSMIASWATGGMDQLQNNPIADPVQDAQSIYEETFGSSTPFSGTTGTGAGGALETPGGTSSLSGTLEPELVAALAANGFKQIGENSLAKNRNVLVEAVKVAYGESGWNTQSINYNGDGGQEDYASYIAGDANKMPTESSGGSSASYDLGLWQINNYWHPNEIRVACGENVSRTSPTAKSEPWKESVQANIDNKNHQKMLDDPLANAKAMAIIYLGWNESWESWVAHGKSQYSSIDAKAKAAVDKYLKNPQQYDQQAISGNLGTGGGAPAVGQDVAYPLPNPRSGEWSGGVADHMSRQLKNWESDNACDLFRDAGTPVYAVADGEITTDGFGYTEPHGTVYGARLHLRTKYGYFFYQHMKKGYAGPEIKQGAKIKKGQLLGYIENGGLIGCASHLHFGMKGGVYGEGESGNPETFLAEVYKQVKK